VAPKDQCYASAYIFGAVCPLEGKAAALVLPVCNSWAMQRHLTEISCQIPEEAHAALVVDGIGWHPSNELEIPDNITLIPLSPYSPELNPVERIWRYLRSHWLSNQVFDDIDAVIDACVDAWNRFVAQPELIASLCHVAGAIPPRVGNS
jgi:hypothetical protein